MFRDFQGLFGPNSIFLAAHHVTCGKICLEIIFGKSKSDWKLGEQDFEVILGQNHEYS